MQRTLGTLRLWSLPYHNRQIELLQLVGLRRFVVDGTPVATGLVVIGDAAVATNPWYGKGCSLAGIAVGVAARAVLLAALLALLALFLVLGGGIVLFSSQIGQVSNDLVDFKEKLLALVADVTLFLTKIIKETFTRDFEFKEFFSPLIGASLDTIYLIHLTFSLMER